ncbi:hypothetical protein Hanom_Chr06g00479241 [Helianthus anomalus]
MCTRPFHQNKCLNRNKLDLLADLYTNSLISSTDLFKTKTQLQLQHGCPAS